MSISVIDGSVLRRRDLTPSAKILLGLLADANFDADAVDAAPAALATACGMNRREALDALRELRVAGLVRVVDEGPPWRVELVEPVGATKVDPKLGPVTE